MNLPDSTYRMTWLDAARGTALLAMATYHFGWDLDLFGYVPGGSASSGLWKLFARCIASTFLFLVGVGIILTHRNGIRWASFWRRWAKVAGAAALVTVATYAAFPQAYVFFGILHHIALASILGLAFLRFHPALLLALAIGAYVLPFMIEPAWLAQPWLVWSGLSGLAVTSNDFVPLFPWFSAVLAGMATASYCQRNTISAPRLIRSIAETPPGRGLAFFGRHSLLTYLIHQPVLLGLVYVATLIIPPTIDIEAETTQFITNCQASCLEQQDMKTCSRFCSCVTDEFAAASILEPVLAGRLNPNQGEAADMVAACSIRSQDMQDNTN